MNTYDLYIIGSIVSPYTNNNDDDDNNNNSSHNNNISLCVCRQSPL